MRARALLAAAALLALAGCVVPPTTAEVSRSAPRQSKKVSYDSEVTVAPRGAGEGLHVRVERLDREITEQATEQTVRTAHWEFDPAADTLEPWNVVFAALLSPVDAVGLIECGVCGEHHPFALWKTAWVSCVPLLNVRRSADGGSPFFGSTPTITESIERAGEKRDVVERRAALPQVRVDIELAGQVACSSYTNEEGDALLGIERLRDLPWERGPAAVVARDVRATLPADFEDGLRRARAEDLYARASIAERDERFDAALDAAKGARALGHPLAASLELRLAPERALGAARTALLAGDLDEAGRDLAPFSADPLTAELARHVLARLARRSLLRARAHLGASRPARALELVAPLLDGPAELRLEASQLAQRARVAWARKCVADASHREPAEALLLDGFALALARTRDARDAFALDLARGASSD